LLEGYGIRMNRDAVIDSRSNLRIPIATESGDQAVVRHCGIVLVANSPSDSHPPLDGGFVPFFRMDQVHFPFASSLTLVPNKQPSDVKALAVARTTPESSVETGATVDMAISEKCPRRPPLESRIVAAVVEGRLASAFGPSSNVRAPEPSRVFVVSSSEFLTNPFAYAHDPSQSDKVLLVLGNAYTKNLVSTILSFKNTIDWMVSEDDLLEASRRSISRAR
jgi:hypothetical protein